MAFSVNGGSSTEVSLANVTTATWTSSAAGSYSLTADTNTVLLANDWGYYFIDAITVVPTPVKPVNVVDVTNGGVAEAEDGIFNGVSLRVLLRVILLLDTFKDSTSAQTTSHSRSTVRSKLCMMLYCVMMSHMEPSKRQCP